jgi:hypothetical protein
MNLSNILLFYRNSLLLTELFLLTLLNQGCEKDPDPLTNHGVIRGNASLYDIYTEEPANIKVTASGPYGSKSTTTEANGNFMIDGLGNGTYYIDYRKENYGTIRQYNIRVFDDDTFYVGGVMLFKKTGNYVPKFIKAYVANKPRFFPLTIYLCIETDVTNDGTVSGLDLMLFLDSNQDVAWNQNKFNYPASDAYVSDKNVHTIYVDPSRMPFKSGTTVYVKGYPCNIQELGYGFLDTYLGIPIYSSLEKSKSTNVVSFIMP